jgi:hypothetical protein
MIFFSKIFRSIVENRNQGDCPLLPYGDKMEQLLRKTGLQKRIYLKKYILEFLQILQISTLNGLQFPVFRKFGFCFVSKWWLFSKK